MIKKAVFLGLLLTGCATQQHHTQSFSQIDGSVEYHYKDVSSLRNAKTEGGIEFDVSGQEDKLKALVNEDSNSCGQRSIDMVHILKHVLVPILSNNLEYSISHDYSGIIHLKDISVVVGTTPTVSPGTPYRIFF